MLWQLPVELNDMIGSLLDEPTLCALCLTCRAFNSIFTSLLFRQNIAINNSSGLLWAVQKDRRDVTEHFISFGADINSRKHRFPLLWYAVQYEAVNTIELLLSLRDADLNRCDDQCWDPLWYALGTGSDEIFISHMLDKMKYVCGCRPAEVAAQSSEISLLQLAVTKGSENVVERLLQQEVELKERDEGIHCFFLAVTYGRTTIAQMFLRRGVNINAVDRDEGQSTALHRAARSDNPVMMSVLLQQHGICVNSRDNRHRTPLHVALDEGKHACIELLLCIPEIDVDARDGDGRTPFWLAAYKGFGKWFNHLLARNVAYNLPDNSGRTPLHNLATSGQDRLARLLLNRKDIELNPIDQWGYTPLACAVQKASISVTKLLLGQPEIKVNVRSENGVTPLWDACQSKRKDIVQLLLAHKDIDIDQKNAFGQPLLHVLIHYNRLHVLKRLLKQGKKLDINVRNKSGHTALMWASYKNRARMVNLLLGVQDIDVNAVDNDGRTAFWWAAAEGHCEIIELLRHNANMQTKDKFEQTAYAAAKERGKGSVLCLLRAP